MTTQARSGTSVRTFAIDAIMIGFVGLVGASALKPAFGGSAWLVAVAGGLLLGLAVAAVGVSFRLSAWPVALLTALAYLLAGPALAVPSYATSRVLPNLGAERALIRGSVGAWRDSLTLTTPLGDAGTVLIVPFVLGLLAGLLAATLLWRSRWPSAAVIPLAGLFVAAATFGDRETDLTLVRGVLLVICLLVWLRWRGMRHVRAKWSRRVALTAAVVIVSGAAGTAMAMATNGSDHRNVLRDHVSPPFDPLDYPSPLSRFRAYFKDLAKTGLVEVDGLPDGARVRIATMDTFDGIVWNVSGGPDSPTSSGTFSRVRPSVDPSDDDVAVTVTVEGYRGVWVPSIGRTGAVTVSDPNGARSAGAESKVLYNKVTGTVAQVGGVDAGTVYHFTSQTSEQPSREQILAAEAASGARSPSPLKVPDKLIQRTTAWISAAGASTGGQQASALEAAFKKGYYSDGLNKNEVPSASGHGSYRLGTLIAEPDMVGNDEQYASAMAVAAQRLGLPARVVLGFKPKPQQTELQGEDISAWVEVDLDGLGWVSFDPTPDKDRVLKQRDQDPDPEPQPQVVQPPDIPQEPDSSNETLPLGAGSKGDSSLDSLLTILLGVLLISTKAVAVLSPLWLIVLVKFIRRRRRRRHPDPVTRMSGGWREVTDGARDLGAQVPISHTRHETSVLLTQRFPASGVAILATTADRHVFGSTDPTDEQIKAYWSDVHTAVKRMRSSAPWWRRGLARFSPASIPWHLVRQRVWRVVRSDIPHHRFVTGATDRIRRRKGRSA